MKHKKRPVELFFYSLSRILQRSYAGVYNLLIEYAEMLYFSSSFSSNLNTLCMVTKRDNSDEYEWNKTR